MAEKKKKKGKPVWSRYEAGKKKNQECPKCGPGVFLAEHKNRRTCGKCHYTEFKKSS